MKRNAGRAIQKASLFKSAMNAGPRKRIRARAAPRTISRTSGARVLTRSIDQGGGVNPQSRQHPAGSSARPPSLIYWYRTAEREMGPSGASESTNLQRATPLESSLSAGRAVSDLTFDSVRDGSVTGVRELVESIGASLSSYCDDMRRACFKFQPNAVGWWG